MYQQVCGALQQRSCSTAACSPAVKQTQISCRSPYVTYEWPVTQPQSAVHQKTSPGCTANTYLVVWPTNTMKPPGAGLREGGRVQSNSEDRSQASAQTRA